MRITSNMMMETTLNNIELNASRMQNLQAQISSGQRISKPSDDPIGSAHALNLQQNLDGANQYGTNLDQASSWLNLTDSSLGALTQSLNRANELAVQAANGTLSTSDLSSISAEVTQIQDQALNVAQTKYGAYFIFSGTASNQPGYTQAAPSTTPGAYQGNSQPVKMAIGPGLTMNVGASPNATFDPAFDALNQLQAALQSGNSAQIQSSLTAINKALDAVSLSRSQVGASSNHVQFLQNQQQTTVTTLTSQLSQVKDVDMAQAITSFTSAQTTYQASLKAAASALQSSLLDFLK